MGLLRGRWQGSGGRLRGVSRTGCSRSGSEEVHRNQPSTRFAVTKVAHPTAIASATLPMLDTEPPARREERA